MRMLLIVLVAVFLTGCSDRRKAKLAPPVVTADQARLHEIIRAQAEDMQKKATTGDLDGFMSYIHPDILAMAGGADKLRQKLAPEMSTMANCIEKTTLGEISEVVDDGGRLVAFVPFETLYRFPNGRMRQKAYRVACSVGGGKTWTFMDGQGSKDQEDYFKSKFPILTKKVPFPQCANENL